MKQLKSNTFVLLFALLCSPLFAQTPHHYFDTPEDRLTKMIEELKLTPEQAEQVKSIQEKYAPQWKKLRENSREIRQQNFEERKVIRKAQKSELQQILTEEQITVLKKKRRALSKHQRLQQQRQRFHKRDDDKLSHKTIREEIRTYILQNIIPVLQSQRTKLNNDLAANDKATIEGFQNKIKSTRPQWREARKNFRESLIKGTKPTEELAQLQELKEAHNADRTQIKALAEKYSVHIEALKKEIEGDIEQWKTDIKTIANKHLEGKEQTPERFQHRSRSFFHPVPPLFPHRMLSKVGFLLLDPDKDYLLEKR